jgi:hypothetical protein
MAFIAPALVLIALALHWLWKRSVVLVAGEPEPSPRGKVQKPTAEWRPEAGTVFRWKGILHPVWGLALPSGGTIRISLIAAAAGAGVGTAAVLDRSTFFPAVSSNDATTRPTDQSNSPISVRTEVVKSQSFSTEPRIQESSPVTSYDGNPRTQRAEIQTRTNGPSSPDLPRCDVSLCERHYRSFDASDCTYQPYQGPRQYCTKIKLASGDLGQHGNLAARPKGTTNFKSR